MTDYVSLLLHHGPTWWKIEVSKHQSLEREKKPLCFFLGGIYMNSMCVRSVEIWEDGHVSWKVDGLNLIVIYSFTIQLSQWWNLLLLLALFLFKCVFYILQNSWWLEILLAFSCSVLHYLNLIVIITCPDSLIIAGLATALIDASLFYSSREIIDIACSPLNLNKTSVYE